MIAPGWLLDNGSSPQVFENPPALVSLGARGRKSNPYGAQSPIEYHAQYSPLIPWLFYG